MEVREFLLFEMDLFDWEGPCRGDTALDYALELIFFLHFFIFQAPFPYLVNRRCFFSTGAFNFFFGNVFVPSPARPKIPICTWVGSRPFPAPPPPRYPRSVAVSQKLSIVHKVGQN